MIILSVTPASLPNQPVMSAPVRNTSAHHMEDTRRVAFGNSRLTLSAQSKTRLVIALSSATATVPMPQQEQPPTRQPETTASPTTAPNGTQEPQAKPQTEQAAQAPATTQEKQPFWERVFNVPPMRVRLEKALSEKWKFPEVRPRYLEFLLSPEEEDARRFFLDGANARQYQRLVKEFGCGFENRNGTITDDSFETLSEYGPELLAQYALLIENRETIKKYYAGLFRNGRIGTQSLIRISNSMWFGPFAAPKFKQFANLLHARFQVPDHVIGPMLGSVGDSFWLPRVIYRKSGPQEFQQLLKKIAPSTEGSGNAFAPALQLLVIGEEHKIPFKTLDDFVENLRLRPQDFGPFSAIIYNLGAYRLADEIKCPTFAHFLRRELDEFGPDINQESGRLFVNTYREFKDNAEALNALQSPRYTETKAFLKSVGTVSSSVWNMQRIAVLTQALTPEKREKIAKLARELSSELTVADIMFLSDICDNEQEVKLLLDRQALMAGVKDIPIDRIVERSHNDLIKELEREIDNANRNGLFRTIRKLRNMIDQEKLAYTERVDPSKLTNIQLSRLLIFHRSIEMPGFLDTVGWNVSLDMQNERSEGGGYLGYDKDMAMVTMVAGQPGDNRAYRPVNLDRAAASLALFHNHAFKDTFAQRYFSFLAKLWPVNKSKDKYAGPSGWLGAEKGDITAAALSELPSFIITKVGHPQNPDGTRNMKAVAVNFDWVIVDQQSGEALRSDRGVYTVPYYTDEQLGKLKWPSRKEMKRREKERREKCPPVLTQQASAPAQQ
jgi:hypothetical protein